MGRDSLPLTEARFCWGKYTFRNIRVRIVRFRWVSVGGVRGSVQVGTQSVRDWLLVAIVGLFNGKMHI